MDYFHLLGMLFTTPFIFVALYTVNKIGLKWCIRLGSCIVFLGSMIRVVATFPGLEQKILPATKFYLVLVGQCIVCIGHPFIMVLITKVSQAWFAESERLLSTASMAITPTLANIFASLVSPVVVADQVTNIKYLNIVYSTPSVIGLLFCLLFCRTSNPPTPASKSGDDNGNGKVYTLKDYFSAMKTVLTNKTILGFMFFVGSLLAIMNSSVSQLAQWMCSVGYSSKQIGTMTALLMASGSAGGITVSAVARKLQNQVAILKISYSLSAIAFIASLLQLREPNLFYSTLFTMMLFGFFAIGCFPLSLELAVEESFPLEPVYSETTMHFPAYAYAFILVNLCNNMTWDQDGAIPHSCGGKIRPWDYTPYFYLVMAELTVSAVLVLFIINPSLKRKDYEHQ